MTKTLKDLLEQAKDSRGVTSGRALAELTSGRENSIDRTQVNQILAGTYKSELRPSTVRAIAWLAGVDEAEAFAAAEQPVPGPPFAKELPPLADYLTPQQRHAVVTVIRALLGTAEEEAGEVRELRAAATKKPAAGPAEQPATTRRLKGEKSNKTVTKLSEGGSKVQTPARRVAKKRSPEKRPD